MGAGMYNNSSTATLINVTIAGNLSTNEGGGLAVGYNSICIMQNSVIWGNSSGLYESATSTFNCSYSLVQGATPSGTGNLNGNSNYTSMFVGPINYAQAPSSSGNYNLAEGSPCINAGNSSYNTQPTDLAGNARIIGSSIDIGAYEHIVLCTVTFNSYGGTYIAPMNITAGTAIGAVFCERENYILEGWYTEAAYINKWNVETDIVSSAMSLHAKWVPATGIEDITTSAINVYPNPANNYIFIDGLNAGDKISITNIAGVKLMEVKANADTQYIDVSSLRSGMYIISAGNKTGKLVISD